MYTNGSLIGEIDPSAPPLQRDLLPEPEKPTDTLNAEAMANYLQQQAEYDATVEQINADFRARRRVLQNADTTFVALSQSDRKTVCRFDNAWLWLIE